MTLRVFEDSPLALGAGHLWREATASQFLSAIRDGTLPQEAFERWLVQDYLFAKGATTFLAIAVAKTPRPAQKTLLKGLNAQGLSNGTLDDGCFRQYVAQDAFFLHAFLQAYALAAAKSHIRRCPIYWSYRIYRIRHPSRFAPECSTLFPSPHELLFHNSYWRFFVFCWGLRKAL